MRHTKLRKLIFSDYYPDGYCYVIDFKKSLSEKCNNGLGFFFLHLKKARIPDLF